MLSPEIQLTRILFPETLVVAFHEGWRDDRCPHTGIVGCEGVIGWSSLLGAQNSTLIGVAQMAGGTALAIDVQHLRDACDASAALRNLLLRFVHNFMAQMAGTIASNAVDAVERRVARWLLMLHDRTEGDELRVTHDYISNALNVRRASVTDCFHILEGEGVLRCARGTVTVRGRAALEGFAGGSYGLVEAQYARDIAPFGRSSQGG